MLCLGQNTYTILLNSFTHSETSLSPDSVLDVPFIVIECVNFVSCLLTKIDFSYGEGTDIKPCFRGNNITISN